MKTFSGVIFCRGICTFTCVLCPLLVPVSRIKTPCAGYCEKVRTNKIETQNIIHCDEKRNTTEHDNERIKTHALQVSFRCALFSLLVLMYCNKIYNINNSLAADTLRNILTHILIQHFYWFRLTHKDTEQYKHLDQ